jgi:hypothetical protein
MSTANAESAVRLPEDLRIPAVPAAGSGSAPRLPNEWVIQKLLGARHWCTDWICAICQADPAFLWHLTQQASGYIHFLCLVRVGIESGRSIWREMSPSQLGKALRSRPRRDVLTTLFPVSGGGLFAVLKRLDTVPMQRKVYEALSRLMAPSPVADTLRHARQISPQVIQFLDDASPELAALRLWLDIRSRAALKKAKFLHAVCVALPPSRCQQSITQRLTKLSTLRQLESWLRRQIVTREFPAPPWMGTEWVYPLRTGAQLHAAALRFKNCVFSHYLEDMMTGKCHFYVCERGPIIYRLDRDPIFGWRIGEREGIKNTPLSRKDDRMCLEEFAAAGIPFFDSADEHYTCLLHGSNGNEELDF